MRGRAELQSGAVLLLVSAAGLVVLRVWESGSPAAAAGTVFTGRGFSSGVIDIMLVGVFAIGVMLVVLGAVLWLIQRARDSRTKAV